MLDELTPEQFNEWWAMYLIEPWGDDWKQTGAICETAYNMGLVTSRAFGGGRIEKSDLRKADDYIPRLRTKKERRATPGRMLGGREAECVLRAQFGG